MTQNHKGIQPIFNCNNMVDPIKKILLNHPKNAFLNQIKINNEFKELNFFDAPDYRESLNEYESSEFYPHPHPCPHPHPHPQWHARHTRTHNHTLMIACLRYRKP